MKNKLSVLGALILTFVIAGSALAGTKSANAAVKTKSAAAAKTKHHHRHHRKHHRKHHKMMKKGEMTTPTK